MNEVPNSATLPLTAPDRALLVGINEYDAPFVRDLRGCVADAEAMAALCRTAFGLPDERLCLLTSPAPQPEARATRAAMIAAIRDFLGATPPGAHALFYYSGHGSTCTLAPELRRDNQGGETLVPADARTSDGQGGTVLDLLDQELRLLFADLADRGIRLTLVWDSCHSGGATRGDAKRQEPVARLTNPGNVVRDLASLLDGTATRERLDQVYHAALPITLLAGALPKQLSFEVPGEAGWRGAMTQALVGAVERAGGTPSYRELMRAVRARVPAHGRRDEQFPNVVGEADALLFSAEPSPRAQPLFAIGSVEPDGSILFEYNDGTVGGVAVGSGLTAFADWGLQEPRGRWQVRETLPRKQGSASRFARAIAMDGPASPEPGQPLQLDASGSALRVRFDESADAVATIWRKNHDSGAPFLTEGAGEADVSIAAEGDFWVVRRRDGSEIEALRQPRSDRFAAGKVARDLDRAICFERFVQAAPDADDRLALSVGPAASDGVMVSAQLSDLMGNVTPLALGEGVGPIRRQATVTVTLRNQSDQTLYLNLYRLNAAGWEAERLWPADGAEEQRPGDVASATWKSSEGGPLTLRLHVSSAPLGGARWPCGQGETTRSAARDLAFVAAPIEGMAGWTLWQSPVGE